MEILGNSYHLAKDCPEEAKRAQTAESYFAEISNSFAGVGLTRVANITDLDHLGIPVWIANRPNSWALAVSQGKGTTHADAKIGAAMESLESYVAEQAQLPRLRRSYSQMQQQHLNCINPYELNILDYSLFHDHQQLDWVEGWDLLNQVSCWVPFQVVHMDMRTPRYEPKYFFHSSNGLASGSHFLEAVYHAICELIERDAWTIFYKTTPSDQWKNYRIDEQSITDKTSQNLIQTLLEKNMRVLILNISSDINIHTMGVFISENETQGPLHLPGSYFGSGTHHNPFHAINRGLTEAVQGRLSLISGSRDDITRSRYENNRSHFHIANLVRLFSLEKQKFNEDSFLQLGKQSVEEDISYALERLAAAGIRQVVCLKLENEQTPIEVARVIIPGLEGATHYSGMKAGKRLTQRLQQT